jgi:hypothetical protein
MRHLRSFPLLSVILALAAPVSSHAEDVYEFVIRKQEKKAATRWNLADWLAQRDRMRLMDLWLAMNSPSPYEFYLGGEYRLFSPEGASGFSGWNTHFGAYAHIFGLELSYTSALSDDALTFASETASQMQALFMLRIFGFNAQATNITLHGGMRLHRGEESYQSAVAGASMAIYLGKFFGIDGSFQHQFESTPNSNGGRFSGGTWAGGGFIEFKYLRVFGQYRSHSYTATQGSEAVLGTRIYF